jgi:DNA-binding transcriptional LysR family regulator
VRRDLDIRPLRTLVTIVDTGGFRRAADILNISQPAVSQHIRRLEALIGEPVFRGQGQSLELSAVGEELLRYARQMVRVNDELVLRLSAEQRRNRVALGVCETLVGVIPGILDGLQEHVPPLRLTVCTGPDAELSKRMSDGTIDVVLKLGHPLESADCVIGEVACAWFGQQHLLENAPLPIAVFAPRSGPLRQLTEDTLGVASLPWQVVYEGVGVEDVVTVSRSGIGISLLFTAAERLWNLPTIPSGLLPDPIRRLPVVLTIGSRLTAEVGHAIHKTVTSTVADYTLAPACTSRRAGGARKP